MAITEVLILHHSHTDLGYLQNPQALEDLQGRYLDQALDLIEATADRDPADQVRWTCEVASVVETWWERRSPDQRCRLLRWHRSGHVSLGAMAWNTTPLSGPEELIRHLDPLHRLRGLGFSSRVAIQHDVNGLPWGAVDILAGAGVEGLLMGINIYMGRAPAPRPTAFAWRGAGGGRLAVWHGEHYACADRVLRVERGGLAEAQASWQAYAERLAAQGYAHDWVMLTATDPVFSDNNPPNPALADLVQAWNRAGLRPRLRFATPEDICDRLRALDLPERSGDWSDAWNFGAASAAGLVAAIRLGRSRLHAAAAAHRAAGSVCRLDEGWDAQLRAVEHTFAPWRTVAYPERESVHLHSATKAAAAWRAVALGTMHLRDGLERLAGNPARGAGQSGILVFNPADEDQTGVLRLPAALKDPRRRHHIGGIHALDMERGTWDGERGFDLGPVRVPARGSLVLPVDALPVPTPGAGCGRGDGWIAHPAWEIAWVDGRLHITDRRSGRRLDGTGPYGFADPVHECVDPQRHPIRPPFWGRDAFVRRDEGRFHANLSCWIADWPALRRGVVWESVATADIPGGVELVRSGRLPGTHHISQAIRLHGHQDAVEIITELDKARETGPESLYLAFPLGLAAGWRMAYDAAGPMARVDADQLPGTCHDWCTSDGAIHLADAQTAVAIAHPDSALWMPHGFRFARESTAIERPADPMPLAWLTCNYWSTNFAAVQPGLLRWRFLMRTGLDAAAAGRFGRTCQRPLEFHPVL
jgi:alpha-mannosidase